MYRVESLPISIPIGRQGENHAMKIEIDCSSFLAEWPQATITAMLRRSVAENPYILVTSIDSNGILTWEPTAHDTGIEGDGQIEIRAVENDVLAKSVTAIVCVERSLTPPEPDTPIDWVENIKSDIAQSVTSAANSASDAAKSAASAQESAAAAAGSASAAQSSANAAAGSASAASKSASDAAGSADAASKSAGDAAQSASDAAASAKAAAGSAAEAAGTLDSVKASADAAAASARAAAESASGAESNKSSAAQAATAAAGSASTASTSASDAAKSAAAASGSAAAAAESKTDAESAASTAKSEADKAAASATAADTSAQAAAGSAAAAAESAQGAADAAKVEAAKIIQDGEIARTSTWSSQRIVDQLYQEITASGNPAVIENALEGYPMSIKASWEPKQEGSGTPSPDNVRPIAGADVVTLQKSSKNLLNPADVNAEIFTPYGLKIELVGENTVRLKGTYEATGGSFVIMQLNTKLLSGRGLKIIDTVTNGTHLAHRLYGLRTRNETAIALSADENGWTPGTAVDMTIKVGVYAPEAVPAEYQPYAGEQSSLALPRTIYGGIIDVATGQGQETWGYIASYAGETLPGEWISDRDAYADDTQPTIGAQVVYKLAAPETFAVTGGGRIDALAGTNTVVTDADSLEVKTRAASKYADAAAGLIDDTVIAEGKAWSSKNIVDKLLPMQTVTGNPVVIETLEGYPLELSASWEPKQEGSGTPSPDNVRPITGGRDSITFTRAEDGASGRVALGKMAYGGRVKFGTRAANVTYMLITISGAEKMHRYANYFYIDGKYDAAVRNMGICSHYRYEQHVENSLAVTNAKDAVIVYNSKNHYTADDAGLEAWRAYLSAQYAAGTPVQICYELATPQEIEVEGADDLPALAGTNTISTDADTVTITAPTPPQTTASAAEAQAAKLDYVAMMADVDVDDLTAVDDADVDNGMDMPTDIKGSETDGKQEV